MATRSEIFKAEQQRAHHDRPAKVKAGATNGKVANGAAAGNGAAPSSPRKPARRSSDDHLKEATPLTGRQLLKNTAPSNRHTRRAG